MPTCTECCTFLGATERQSLLRHFFFSVLFVVSFCSCLNFSRRIIYDIKFKSAQRSTRLSLSSHNNIHLSSSAAINLIQNNLMSHCGDGVLNIKLSLIPKDKHSTKMARSRQNVNKAIIRLEIIYL